MSCAVAKHVHNGYRLYRTACSVKSGVNQETLKQPSLAVEKEDCTRLEGMLSYTSGQWACTGSLWGQGMLSPLPVEGSSLVLTQSTFLAPVPLKLISKPHSTGTTDIPDYGKIRLCILCFISSEPFTNIKQGNETAKWSNKKSSHYLRSCLRWHSSETTEWLTTDLALGSFHLTNAITNGFITPKQSFASSAEAEYLGAPFPSAAIAAIWLAHHIIYLLYW